MQEFFFVPSITGGEMTKRDLKVECLAQSWLPIMIVNTPNGIIVPVFKDSDICLRFIKRNVPPKEVVLQVKMDIRDLKKFTDKGWTPVWLEFPNSYKSRPNHSIEIGIIETKFNLKYQ